MAAAAQSPTEVVADAFYAIGSDHTICEDFAASAPGVAVVCDGCSSSPGSDWGARLLAQSVLQHPTDVGLALRRAGLVARAIGGLPATCLDATVGLARREGDAMVATLWGDGVVAALRNDGSVDAIVVAFPSGAPAYPSYALDADADHAWRRHFGDEVTVQRGSDTTTQRWNGPLCWAFRDVQGVVVATDGLLSFSNGDSAVPPEAVLSELLAIRVSTGAYLTRRCRRFLARRGRDDGWRHHDDFAAAALWRTDAGV